MVDVSEHGLVLAFYECIKDYDMQPAEQEDTIKFFLKNYLHVYNEQNAELFDSIIRDTVQQKVFEWIKSCIKR